MRSAGMYVLWYTVGGNEEFTLGGRSKLQLV